MKSNTLTFLYKGRHYRVVAMDTEGVFTFAQYDAQLNLWTAVPEKDEEKLTRAALYALLS